MFFLVDLRSHAAAAKNSESNASNAFTAAFYPFPLNPHCAHKIWRNRSLHGYAVKCGTITYTVVDIFFCLKIVHKFRITTAAWGNGEGGRGAKKNLFEHMYIYNIVENIYGLFSSIISLARVLCVSADVMLYIRRDL